jgi:hypothetical protein
LTNVYFIRQNNSGDLVPVKDGFDDRPAEAVEPEATVDGGPQVVAVVVVDVQVSIDIGLVSEDLSDAQ